MTIGVNMAEEKSTLERYLAGEIGIDEFDQATKLAILEFGVDLLDPVENSEFGIDPLADAAGDPEKLAALQAQFADQDESAPREITNLDEIQEDPNSLENAALGAGVAAAGINDIRNKNIRPKDSRAGDIRPDSVEGDEVRANQVVEEAAPEPEKKSTKLKKAKARIKKPKADDFFPFVDAAGQDIEDQIKANGKVAPKGSLPSVQNFEQRSRLDKLPAPSKIMSNRRLPNVVEGALNPGIIPTKEQRILLENKNLLKRVDQLLKAGSKMKGIPGGAAKLLRKVPWKFLMGAGAGTAGALYFSDRGDDVKAQKERKALEKQEEDANSYEAIRKRHGR